MTRPASSRATLLVVGLVAPFLGFGAPVAAPAEVAPRPAMAPDTVLYGAAYYHEYMPYDRLDKDIELMKRAGITVVRVGESTWTSWEPREGEQLGEITLVDLLKVGETVTKGEKFGVIESVNSVSDLYAPVSGRVVAVNAELKNAPADVTADPYEARAG